MTRQDTVTETSPGQEESAVLCISIYCKFKAHGNNSRQKYYASIFTGHTILGCCNYFTSQLSFIGYVLQFSSKGHLVRDYGTIFGLNFENLRSNCCRMCDIILPLPLRAAPSTSLLNQPCSCLVLPSSSL